MKKKANVNEHFKKGIAKILIVAMIMPIFAMGFVVPKANAEFSMPWFLDCREIVYLEGLDLGNSPIQNIQNRRPRFTCSVYDYEAGEIVDYPIY